MLDRATLLRRTAALGAAAYAAGAPLRIIAAPKAGAGVSPDAALAKLLDGNRAFARAMIGPRSQTIEERVTLGSGQAPWASVLTCADSRLSPEIIFTVGLGDIFVARVAGNVPDPAETASLEYGAAVLGSQLIVVMGHSSCGAVEAAIAASRGETMPSEDLRHLVATIEPAVKSVQGKPGDELVNATKANVINCVHQLRATPLLKDLAGQRKLKVVGAYYELTSGRVSLLV